MTSSGQTPRIRRTAYEPATAQPQASIVASPHCRATFAVGAAAGAVEEADAARAAVPVDLPDAGALRVPVARVASAVTRRTRPGRRRGRRPHQQFVDQLADRECPMWTG
jgi:hypothetical protein